MKVCFISHYSSLYGANRSLLNLIDGLYYYGVECYVLVPSKGDLIPELDKRNIDYRVIPFRSWIHSASQVKSKPPRFFLEKRLKKHINKIRRARDNLFVIPRIVSQIRSWNIDIVYTNSIVTPVGFFAALFLRLPHIWHVREFVDLDYQLRFDWSKSLAKMLLYSSTSQIFISKSILRHFQPTKRQTGQVIYNGVAFAADFDRRKKEAQQSPVSAYFTFSLVGVVNPNKGQHVAVEAIGYLKSDLKTAAYLILVGGGDTESLKTRAQQLGISENVAFWGYVDDPQKAYRASQVVLMCSQNEGMGRVTVEAMSACKPVIGYDSSGTAELIKHQETGLLYSGGHRGLALAMKKCIDNPEWTNMLGQNAWCYARQKFTVELYTESVYQVLKEHCTKRKVF